MRPTRALCICRQVGRIGRRCAARFAGKQNFLRCRFGANMARMFRKLAMSVFHSTRFGATLIVTLLALIIICRYLIGAMARSILMQRPVWKRFMTLIILRVMCAAVSILIGITPMTKRARRNKDRRLMIMTWRGGSEPKIFKGGGRTRIDPKSIRLNCADQMATAQQTDLVHRAWVPGS